MLQREEVKGENSLAVSSALASFDNAVTRSANAELTITYAQDEVVFRETVFEAILS